MSPIRCIRKDPQTGCTPSDHQRGPPLPPPQKPRSTQSLNILRRLIRRPNRPFRITRRQTGITGLSTRLPRLPALIRQPTSYTRQIRPWTKFTRQMRRLTRQLRSLAKLTRLFRRLTRRLTKFTRLMRRLLVREGAAVKRTCRSRRSISSSLADRRVVASVDDDGSRGSALAPQRVHDRARLHSRQRLGPCRGRRSLAQRIQRQRGKRRRHMRRRRRRAGAISCVAQSRRGHCDVWLLLYCGTGMSRG